MKKHIVSILCACLLSFGVFAQSNSIESILQSVENNNKELQAYLSFIDSKKLELKANNNLPDPEVGGYYLPWGDHNTGSYSEFEISQTIEFPTVYGRKNKLIENQHQQLQSNYDLKRQEILIKAQSLCLELIYMDKLSAIEQERLAHSKTVFEQAQQLFTSEENSQLEFSKAKIAWMQQQFKVQQIKTDQQNVLLQLKNLNGNQEIIWNSSDYSSNLIIADRDSLWQSKLVKDPELQKIQQQELLAQQTLKVAKSQSLPDLSLGYNYQGVAGSNYSGIYGGISIPLWNNKNKVKAAKSNLLYQTTNSESAKQLLRVEFDKQYNEYQMVLLKYNEYQKTLSELNSDKMLLQAYQLGEISFMEYYIEMQFYHQAYDSMLAMENQLQHTKTQLLKHQL